MFKVLLLQRWYNLSDQGMDDALADRISFRRFAGFSFEYDTEVREDREGEDCGYQVTTRYSDDVEAAWTVKGKRPYYGFKLHMATDAEHGFIIGGHVTSANRSDTKELLEVVKESGIPKGAMVFADKGYTSAENRAALETRGLTDGIMYKAGRGKKLSEAEAAHEPGDLPASGQGGEGLRHLEAGLWIPSGTLPGMRQGETGISP
jgi:IS5 family transposase